jgi:hypothetical protein
MYFMLVRMPLRQSRATFIGGIFVLQYDHGPLRAALKLRALRDVPGARLAAERARRTNPYRLHLDMSTKSDFKSLAEEEYALVS